MNKKKIMSLIMALVMLVGVFSPLTAFATNGNEPALPGTTGAGSTYKKPVSTIAADDVQKDKPENTKVIVHKLQADSYHKEIYPKGIDHDGGKIQDLSGIGSNVTELNDVEFTVYKLKDAAQLETFIKTPSSYETTDQVEAVNGVEKVTGITNPIKTANGAGAEVTLPDGYYWFVESKSPETVSSSIAVPFGLSIPVMNKVKVGTYDKGTAYLKNVHVYPKNVTGTEPEPKKTVGNEVNMNESHQVGKVQTWFLQATVPGNIQDYETFKMVDYFSKGLTYKGNVKVYLGYDGIADSDKKELTLDTDYTLTQPAADTKFTTDIPNTGDITVASGQEFKIELKAGSDDEKVGIRKLADEYQAMKAKAGDKPVKLYATVDTVINEDAKMGVEIPNAYDLKFKKKGSDEKTKRPENPKVETGGKKFIKVSETDKSKKLAGAVFELYDGSTKMTWTKELIAANKTAIEAGKFATKADDNKEEYTATNSINNLEGKTIYLQSDTNGLFEIKGLEYSKWTKTLLDKKTEEHTHDYKIKEVKFPEGYAGNKAEFPFTVDKNSYKDNAEGYPANTHDAQGNKLIENKPLTIPQTGGMGTVLFTVVGISLMAGAVVAMKRNREEA